MGCDYISTKGQLAPALAKVFGKSVRGLDTAGDQAADGKFTPCEVVIFSNTNRSYLELGPLNFLIDDGDGVIDGDDVFVSQTDVWQGDSVRERGFVGGPLKKLIDGYERGALSDKPGQVVKQLVQSKEWADRFWAAIRKLGRTSYDPQDARLVAALKDVGPMEYGTDFKKKP